MSYSSHEKPAYYNLITVIAGYVPYTLLVIISLFAIKYKSFDFGINQWWKKLRNRITTMDSAHLFSLLSIVIIFVFYCIPKSKRSVTFYRYIRSLPFLSRIYNILLSHKHKIVLKVFGNIMAGISILLVI